MQSIKAVKNQSLFDLAIQLYGNIDAVQELLTLNPDLITDYSGSTSYDDIDLGYPVQAGQTVFYDETSSLRIKTELDELPATNGVIDPIATWEAVNV